MLNSCLIFVEIFLAFTGVLLSFKFFKKEGVFAWVCVATILANIITAKTANIFGMDVAIGTVLFSTVYLSTDIISEFYGKQESKKAVMMGLCANIVFIFASQIALMYIPSKFDYAHSFMKDLFGLNLRISVASAVMYYISNLADIYLFDKLKRITKGKHLWLRNNVSTILCNCLENFFFIFLAFFGTFDLRTVFSVALCTSAVELICALCDTPFLYFVKFKIMKEN